MLFTPLRRRACPHGAVALPPRRVGYNPISRVESPEVAYLSASDRAAVEDRGGDASTQPRRRNSIVPVLGAKRAALELFPQPGAIAPTSSTRSRPQSRAFATSLRVLAAEDRVAPSTWPDDFAIPHRSTARCERS